MIDLHETLDIKDPDAEKFLMDLQGNILKPHGRQHTTLLFLKFKLRNTYLARQWLSQLAREECVTSAWEQSQHNTDKLFCMALLSYYGYQKLYANDLASNAVPGDESFRLGPQFSLPLSARSATSWRVTGENDALILLAHDDRGELQKREDEIRSQVAPFGFVESKHGIKLPRRGKQQPGEHFGFADGIGRPLFFREDVEEYRQKVGSDLRWDPATSLDQVLVPETQKHDDGSTTYGSYMAFYQIAQDPDLFNRSFDAAQAAKVMGREKDGTPLIAFGGGELNNFNYDGDPEGKQCPLNAHIRKANDRGDATPRIARRGVAFDNGEKDRGVFFMSFQADLHAQFESMLDRVQEDALSATQGLIKPTMGQYFYAPSIQSLEEMATLRKDQQRRLNNALELLMMDDEKLATFATLWDADKRYDAGREVGIVPDDLDTVYSILRVGDEKRMRAIGNGRDKLEELTHASAIPPVFNRQKQKAAFQKLLFDPALLQSFLELWPQDPPQALELVDLTPEDEQGLYDHCADLGINLEWKFWR
jgi:Dyp-type peroxidase family